jgi:hypothetical protein
MMRLTIALLFHRQLEEALFHAFECPDEGEDRFDNEGLSERMENHRRLIVLTGEKIA